MVLSKKDMGQTTKQQRHFNKWPISELHGEVDSFQTSLKLLFTSQQQWYVLLFFSALRDGFGV
jgi:hypothetical protein